MRYRLLFGLLTAACSLSAYAGTNAAFIDPSHLLLTLAGFYGAGLLLAFTPCVLPMVPILSSILAGQHQPDKTQTFRLSLVFVLSMALTYAVAGMLAGYLGSTVQTLMQQTWIIVSFSLIFVLMAGSMFGVFHVSMPAFMQRRAHDAHDHVQAGSMLGVAAMGVLSTLIASPCVTAPLISVLTFISQSGNPVQGGLILFVLALGMGTPLILFGMGQATLLPKAGMWMEQVKNVFGVMMLGLAIWMLSRILPGIVIMFLWSALLIISAVAFGALNLHAEKRLPPALHGVSILMLTYGVLMLAGAASGSDDVFAPLHLTMPEAAAQEAPAKRSPSSLFTYVDTLPALQRKIAAAKEMQKPVMIEFFATWCPFCKKVDTEVLSNDNIRNKMKAFATIRVDISERNPELAKIMEQYQVLGVPTMIFIDKHGNQVNADSVNQEITVESLQPMLDKLS